MSSSKTKRGGIGNFTHGNPHDLNGITYDISGAFFAFMAFGH
jgi:hypothetical protein